MPAHVLAERGIFLTQEVNKCLCAVVAQLAPGRLEPAPVDCGFAERRRPPAYILLHADMRCGFHSLALQVQEKLKRDPDTEDLYVFRGRRGDLIKVIWFDGQGACLFSKRLERGRLQDAFAESSPARVREYSKKVAGG